MLTTSLGFSAASAERPEDTLGREPRSCRVSPFLRAIGGPDQRPVAPEAPRGPAGALPSFSLCLPPVPKTAEARKKGELEAAPVLGVTCIPFHSPSRGNLSLLRNRGAPRIASPSDLCIVKLKTRNPLLSPSLLPLPLHPYLPHFYLATIRVFLNSGEVGNG